MSLHTCSFPSRVQSPHSVRSQLLSVLLLDAGLACLKRSQLVSNSSPILLSLLDVVQTSSIPQTVVCQLLVNVLDVLVGGLP